MATANQKKVITLALCTALGTWGLAPVFQGGQALAQTGTDTQGSVDMPMQSPSEVFKADAPDRHTVVRGDTLWGIAGKYLTKPWLWPQIWKMNREQIKNPHWIYPGQVIVLDKLNGTMHLADEGDGKTVYLRPQVQIDKDHQAIPSIPQDVIEPFLSQPLVVSDGDMRDAPRIIGTKGDRVVLGRGDVAYVAGITDPSLRDYQVFRPGIPMKDPETGALLGYQADYLGTVHVTRDGEPATVEVTSFAQEINIGDRLVPSSKPALINYAPHAPSSPIKGRVVLTYGGTGFAARGMIVAINKGSADGLEIGHVLATQTAGQTITDKTNGSAKVYKLPDERNGLLFVFRVFDKVSYALVMQAQVPIETGDVFTQP